MDYYKFFTTDNKSGWKNRRDRLFKKHPNIVLLIDDFCDKNGLNTLPFKIKVWHFINNEPNIPLCKNCNKQVKYRGSLKEGYSNFCSLQCSASNKETRDKYKKTSLEKYGFDTPTKNKKVRDKYKKTCLEKYGVDNVSKNKEIRDKIEKTCLEKYGSENYLSSDDKKNKTIDTLNKKYGVNHFSKTKQFKIKVKKTLNDNYGVDNVMKLKTFKENQKKSLSNNYGVDNPMFSNEIKNKIKETNLEKYGNENYNSSEIGKKTNIENNIKRIFKKYSSNNDELISYNYKGVDNGDLTIFCSKCENNYEISRHLFRCRGYTKKITCINCNPISSQESNQENEVKTYIQSLNIPFETNNRVVLDNQELDIYIPDKGIAIEYNGLYWHSEQFKDKNYHLSKTNLCEEKGIQLIHIFEDEWVHKNSIVKSRLKNILGITKTKIYGRKCIIKEVLTKDKTKFLNENHIQGSVGSNINLGLYYNDELVSLMTFGKRKIINSNEFELIRFCNKLDTTVIGGFSKLLKHFIKGYNPKEIISYADRRWSLGNVYEKNGFTFKYNTKPNFYYILNKVRHNRLKFQKHKLVKEGYDKSKSEREIMNDRGINRIYDCGNKVFIINL